MPAPKAEASILAWPGNLGRIKSAALCCIPFSEAAKLAFGSSVLQLRQAEPWSEQFTPPQQAGACRAGVECCPQQRR